MRAHGHLAVGALSAALISDSEVAVAAAAGFAVLPDAPYAVGFARQAWKKRLRGMKTGDLFTSWTLIRTAWLLHALPTLAIALGLSWWSSPRWLFEAILAGWGSHLVADALTHVQKPYPFLYPFSWWRFRGIASYWEAEFHAGAVKTLEWAVVTVGLAWLMWWRG